jgi:hypothetical protein
LSVDVGKHRVEASGTCIVCTLYNDERDGVRLLEWKEAWREVAIPSADGSRHLHSLTLHAGFPALR